MKTVGIWGDMTVSYMDYVIFAPQTAEVVTKGRVEPSNRDVVISGAKVPTVNKKPQGESGQLMTVLGKSPWKFVIGLGDLRRQV